MALSKSLLYIRSRRQRQPATIAPCGTIAQKLVITISTRNKGQSPVPIQVNKRINVKGSGISRSPFSSHLFYTPRRNVPRAPVDRITGWLGGLPAPVARAFLFANKPGFPPSRVAPSISLTGGSGLSFHQMTGGFPQVKRIKFSLRRVAKSFLLIMRLGVSPPPHNLKFSLSPTAQGFLLRT
jgi:hypothetical protein